MGGASYSVRQRRFHALSQERLPVTDQMIRILVIRNYEVMQNYVFPILGLKECDVMKMNKEDICKNIISTSNTLVEQFREYLEGRAIGEKERMTGVTGLPCATADSVMAKPERGKRMRTPVLRNFDNSCYLDSVMMVLLVVLGDFTSEFMFKEKSSGRSQEKPVLEIAHHGDLNAKEKLKRSMLEIQRRLLDEKSDSFYCLEFKRKVLSECRTVSYGNFSEDERNEAGEFLSFIFTVFGVDPTQRVECKKYRLADDRMEKTWEVDVDYHDRTSPIEIIEWTRICRDAELVLGAAGEYSDGSIRKLSDLFPGQWSTTMYDFVRNGKDAVMKRWVIIDTPLLVIDIQRGIGRDANSGEYVTFIRNSVIPDESLRLGDFEELTAADSLNLVASVIFMNGHYTATLRHQGEWYYYDDTAVDDVSGSLELMGDGSFDGMLGFRDCLVSKFATLHFYAK